MTLMQELKQMGVNVPETLTPKNKHKVLEAIQGIVKTKQTVRKKQETSRKHTLPKETLLLAVQSLLPSLILLFGQSEKFTFANAIALEHALCPNFISPMIALCPKALTQSIKAKEELEELFIAFIQIALIQGVPAVKQINQEEYYTLYGETFLNALKKVRNFLIKVLKENQEIIKVDQMILSLEEGNISQIEQCATRLFSIGGYSEEKWKEQIKRLVEMGKKFQLSVSKGANDETLKTRTLNQIM